MKILQSVPYPLLRLHLGVEKTVDDFQFKTKKIGKRALEEEEDNILLFSTVGHITPPEVNFFYNPALSLWRNIELDKTNSLKVNSDDMYRDCNSFEKFCFLKSSITHKNKRIRPELLIGLDTDEIYDSSFLNTYIDNNDDYNDVVLNVQNFYTERLYENTEFKKLLSLTRKVYFERLPKVLKEIEETDFHYHSSDQLK